MNCLIIMDPYISIPPEHYGGIERVIADVAEVLACRGHQLTLWAAPGSKINGRVESFGREGEWTWWSNVRNMTRLAGRFVVDASRFDVVHNFGRLAYLLPILRTKLPKVQTYMRTVDSANMTKARRLGAQRLHYTAVSGWVKSVGETGGGDWSVVYNCAVPGRYRFVADTDPLTAPLVFLGRLDRIKGPHHAIAVAKRLGRRLIIAGNVSTLPHEREYFEREVAPRIDGDLITYIGPADDEQKRTLLGQGAAMLLPVEGPDAFPIVVPESMMCGTPVIAFPAGGIPEGIDHGRTGFLCRTVEEMTSAVNRLGEIDRAVVRAEAVRRFSDEAVASGYERVYERLVGA